MTSAELTVLLRASKPSAPDELRERVLALTAGEPAGARSLARLRLPRLRFAVPALAATALAAAGVIAVVQPRSDSQREQAFAVETKPSQQVTRSAAAPPATTRLDSAAPTEKAQAGSIGSAPGTTPGRAQDYQAQLTIEVSDGDALSEAAKRALAIARELGGYAVNVSYASSETGSATMTLRVPSDRVQDALLRFSGLGRITSQHVQIDDLQETLDRLDRTITVLRQRIAHISALLANPNLTAERRAQLEAQRGQLQASLREQRQSRAATSAEAQLATFQLELRTKEQQAAPAPSRLHRTLDRAGEVLAWEGVAALYALVVVAPFALLVALAWLGARTRRRGEERRLLARS